MDELETAKARIVTLEGELKTKADEGISLQEQLTSSQEESTGFKTTIAERDTALSVSKDEHAKSSSAVELVTKQLDEANKTLGTQGEQLTDYEKTKTDYTALRTRVDDGFKQRLMSRGMKEEQLKDKPSEILEAMETALLTATPGQNGILSRGPGMGGDGGGGHAATGDVVGQANEELEAYKKKHGQPS